jgi:hypothetical protein
MIETEDLRPEAELGGKRTTPIRTGSTAERAWC